MEEGRTVPLISMFSLFWSAFSPFLPVFSPSLPAFSLFWSLIKPKSDQNSENTGKNSEFIGAAHRYVGNGWEEARECSEGERARLWEARHARLIQLGDEPFGLVHVFGEAMHNLRHVLGEQHLIARRLPGDVLLQRVPGHRRVLVFAQPVIFEHDHAPIVGAP